MCTLGQVPNQRDFNTNHYQDNSSHTSTSRTE